MNVASREDTASEHALSDVAAVLVGARMVSWTWHRSTNRVVLTPNAREILGWPSSEPLEQQGWMLDCLHPLDAEERNARLEHALETRHPFSGEFRIVRQDNGETEWIEERGTVFVSDTGDVSLSAVLWSVSARKHVLAYLAASTAGPPSALMAAVDQLPEGHRPPPARYASLLRSEQRLQSAFQIETVGIAFFANSGQITETNDAYLRMFGLPHGDLFAGTLRWGDGTAPEWAGLLSRMRAEYQRTARVVPHERACVRRDGSHWWGLFAARRLNEHEGIEYVVDITNRIDAERELRESQRRMRVLIEGIPQIVWRASGNGRWTWASPQWTQLTGQPESHSHDFGWLDMVHPDDRARVKRQWERARVAETFALDYRLWHVKENRFRVFKTRARPVRDDTGRISEWLGTSTDVDDLEQLHAREQVLNAELQHRTRNLLALVRSVARQTLTAERCDPQDLAVFDSRLAALGRVQKLLGSGVPGISLRELLEAELSAVGEAETEFPELRGPDVLLPATHVQTLALALHELATNAAKYGAIAYAGAHLRVRWKLDTSSRNARMLHLDWIETGVPMPASPPARKGFGRELLEQALTFTLGARTELVFGQDGVRFHIALPL
jgi:PAS domain S-box-containing protein